MSKPQRARASSACSLGRHVDVERTPAAERAARVTAPGPRFLLRRPDDAAMRAFMASQRDARSTYATLGAAEQQALLGIDRSTVIGEGAVGLARAKNALERWAQYPAPWTCVISEHAPPEVGDVTCARLCHLGFWSLVACRVTRIEDVESARSIVIETLEGHAEVGVETFSVSLDERERVVYRIESRSGPGHVLARIGEPVMRHYQERFLRESPEALRAAMAGSR